MATKSKDSVFVELKTMASGIKAKLDAKTSFLLCGKAYKPQDVVALLQSHIAAYDAVDSAEGQLKAARAARASLAQRLKPLRRALELHLRAVYGADSPRLMDFGLVPSKRRKVKAETKAQAVEKARATRKARGTLGKKARLKIKGKLPDGGDGGGKAPTGAG